jgi:hypothetical protein
MTLSRAVTWSRRNLGHGIGFLGLYLASRISIVLILMLSPRQSMMALAVDLVVMVCGFAIFVRDILSKRFLAASIVAALVLLDFSLPLTPELRQIIALYYRFQTSATRNYAARCQPAAGVPIDGSVIRVCDQRDWGYTDTTMAVVKLDGDPRSLTGNAQSRVRPGPRPLDVTRLPFGIVKYDDIHIGDDYYLLFFGIDPVTTADK